MSLESASFITSDETEVEIGLISVGSVKCPVHVLVDGFGTPYSASNPVPFAPAVIAADFYSVVDAVPVGGGNIHTVPASASRSGGFIQAGEDNNGVITVTLFKTADQTLVQKLRRGESFPLVVAPGRVLQHQFTVAGDTQGDIARIVVLL